MEPEVFVPHSAVNRVQDPLVTMAQDPLVTSPSYCLNPSPAPWHIPHLSEVKTEALKRDVNAAGGHEVSGGTVREVQQAALTAV